MYENAKKQNKGPYRIISLQNGLLHFVKNAQLKLHDEFDLMEHLPLMRSGMCINITATSLFFNYLRINDLSYQNNFMLNNLLNECFSGTIPSYNIYYENGKVTSTDAISKGLIKKPMNTFDVIRKKYPEFINNLKKYYIASIVTLNYIVNNNDIDENTKKQLWFEHNLLGLVTHHANRINRSCNVISILTHGNDKLIQYLVKNNYLKLLYDIIHSNTNNIIEGLKFIYTTKYDCELYLLASYKTKKIVLYNILERNFYYKQVLNQINLIYKDSNIPETLYNYFKLL